MVIAAENHDSPKMIITSTIFNNVRNACLYLPEESLACTFLLMLCITSTTDTAMNMTAFASRIAKIGPRKTPKNMPG